MGNCLGSRNQPITAEVGSEPPLSEEEQVQLQISRIDLFVDAYNREVEKLNKNIETCNIRALEYKKKNSKQLAMFFLNKRKLLEAQAENYNQKSMMLADRKIKIEQLRDERDFFRVMKEANDLLEKHLNQNTINEIRRANELSDEINQRDETLKAQAQEVYSPEIEDEFDALDAASAQKRVAQSVIRSVSINKPPAKGVGQTQMLMLY